MEAFPKAVHSSLRRLSVHGSSILGGSTQCDGVAIQIQGRMRLLIAKKKKNRREGMTLHTLQFIYFIITQDLHS